MCMSITKYARFIFKYFLVIHFWIDELICFAGTFESFHKQIGKKNHKQFILSSVT